MREPSINELLSLLSGAIDNAGPDSPNDLDTPFRIRKVAEALTRLAVRAHEKAGEMEQI